MRVVDQLLFFSAARPSHPVRSLSIVALLLGWILLTNRALLAPDVVPANDGHALAALDMAITRVLCGAPSAFSLKYRAPMWVRDHPETKHQSLRQMMIDQAGSLDAYCAAINQPFVNNENSLMVVEILLLRINPNLSFVGMGRSLHALRVAGLMVVAFVLLESGFSIWLTAAAFVSGLMLLRILQEHTASVYPFLFVLVSVAAAGYSWAAARQWTQASTLLSVAFVAGAFSSFGVNMRTSYLPVYVVLFLLFLLFTEGRLARLRTLSASAASWRIAASLAVFLAGYQLFQYVAIARHIPANMTYNSTAHSVAHPLVLALGVPENDFSRGEGIHWQDAVGGDLALRAIPGAVYLGPRYDEALFKYYRQLWREHPREMASLYWLKAKTAGKHMLELLRASSGVAGRMARVVLLPLDLLPNGVFLLALFVILASAGCILAITRSSAAMAFLGLMSAAAVLLQIESAVIMSLYVPNYHNFLVFYVTFISLCAFQWAANVAGRAVGIRRSS